MVWQIGNITIPNQTVLGPMAGVTDLPLRLLCKEQGAGLTVMEMISAKAVTFHNRKTREIAMTVPEEGPVALQIFGHEPDVMGACVDQINDWQYDILDINMGCPVPKVVNNGEGSALMKSPELIERIVDSCVQHSRKPVTVKMRIGYTQDQLNVVECARAAEAGGASMIAVHGRTRSQMYSGQADWSKIAEVVQAVKVPVVGNGDVRCGADARRLMDETGCTAVMIARAAEGNPWVFREINHYLDTGVSVERPGRGEVAQMIRRHAALMQQYKEPHVAIMEMRKHVAWYVAGFPGASALRKQVNTVTSFEELEDLLRREFPYHA